MYYSYLCMFRGISSIDTNVQEDGINDDDNNNNNNSKSIDIKGTITLSALLSRF